MAENVVVKEPLTADMIEAGAELIAKLDAMGQPLRTALWLWELENNEWQLVLAFPDVHKKGMGPWYTKIQEARKQLGQRDEAIPMFAPHVVDTDHDVIRRLRSAFQHRGNDRFRLKNTAVDGHIIDDALVYRIV